MKRSKLQISLYDRTGQIVGLMYADALDVCGRTTKVINKEPEIKLKDFPNLFEFSCYNPNFYITDEVDNIITDPSGLVTIYYKSGCFVEAIRLNA